MKRMILIFLVAAATMSCDAVIGDSCSANVDCSSSGNRLCDTSMPGGYCTVEGCSASSCPDGALCVAFFPTSMLTVPCDPASEDLLGSAAPTDDCAPYEVCLTSGFCAPASLERRFCMKKCGGEGDCRGGYTCRTTGELGSQRVPGDNADYATIGTSRFCVAEE